ncbi:MAG TPA: TetR/AcrR family transcriptional regulator [Bryobacteraceae bacterium]|jgi:AcrR family transcriptional regulator|nr:TetR/AcrR family transcriptional regulator [Bryobacteraceae bacterium]
MGVSTAAQRERRNSLPSHEPGIHLRAFINRRRDPDSKKEAVLRVAVRLFLERGFWRTSLSEVAEQLRITKPALYHYFRNKEEIYLECYRRGVSLIDTHLERLRSQTSSGAEKVAGFIYIYAIVIASDFGRCVVRQDDRELSPAARAEVRAYKREIDHALRDFIQQGVADGSVRACDVKLAAFAIAGAVNALAVWFEPGRGWTGREVAAELARTLTQGLTDRRKRKFRLPEITEGER